MRYLTMSAYDFIISNAFEIIGEENVHLVDGVNVVENPKDEFSKLLRFLGADDSLDFRFNNEKGISFMRIDFSIEVSNTNCSNLIISKKSVTNFTSEIFNSANQFVLYCAHL